MKGQTGKRPKGLAVVRAPKKPGEAEQLAATFDVLQAGCKQIGVSNYQQLTIAFWNTFADEFVRSVEGNEHAPADLRAIAARYRRHVRPVDAQAHIIAPMAKSISGRFDRLGRDDKT